MLPTGRRACALNYYVIMYNIIINDNLAVSCSRRYVQYSRQIDSQSQLIGHACKVAALTISEPESESSDRYESLINGYTNINH